MNNLNQLWNEDLNFPTKRIAIIGAGISGLISGALLKKEGFKTKIFERNQSYGGVWEIGYSNLKLQSPSNLYQIPFFKPTQEWSEYPCALEIRNYINEFVDQNNLHDDIHCSHEVISISQGSKRTITYKYNGEVFSEEFDFVIISTGVFSDARVPKVKGEEKFKGTITHTSKFYNSEITAGKNAVVVGLGKSSLDCMNAIKDKAAGVTFLYRTLYWPIPEYIEVGSKKLRPDEFLSNRFMITIKNGSPPRDNDPLERFAHKTKLGKKIVEKIFTSYENKIEDLYHLSELGMRPEKRIQDDVYATFIAPLEVYKGFHSGKIAYHKEEIAEMKENSLITTEGREVPCDVLVFGTGFSPKMNFLHPNDLKALFDYDEEVIYLYRSIINPKIPNLAFIGFMPTLCNPLTSALSVLWLIKVFKEEISLNNSEMMKGLHEDSGINKAFHQKCNMKIKGNLIKDLHLYDSLVEDMREKSRRKGGNKWEEYFATYTPDDYSELFSAYM